MNLNETELNKLTKVQLINICDKLKLVNCKSKNKKKIIELILENQENKEELNLISLLEKLINNYSLKIISEKLNLATGTISRWIELNKIPRNYEFDILKLSDIKIDYSKYSSKEKDQFFTPIETAKYCFEIFSKQIKKFEEKIDDFKYIEPSAGDGSFLSVLPTDTIGIDIEPKNSKIIEQDFLDWKPSIKERYVVFGNPPFGLRGHLALKFINYSYEFAEYVCFILPQLFESDGKGVPRKRVKGYNLIHSEKLESTFYEPNKNELKINTIFQIWSKHHKNEEYNIKEFSDKELKIYSISDGGTASSTRNKNMIGKCDIYIPSTCFGKENMKYYYCFEDLPGKKGYGIVFYENKNEMMQKMIKINWNEVAFLSTNSAYNLRISQIYSALN